MKKILSIIAAFFLISSVALAYTPITRQRNFVNDANNGIPITASYVDGELNQFVTAANGTLVAQGSAPSSPFAGEFWYDTTNKLLKQYRNNEWVVQGIVHVGTSSPATSQTGDLWYDSTNNLLKTYNGSSYITIVPDNGSFTTFVTTGNVGIGTTTTGLSRLQVRAAANKNFLIGPSNLLSDGVAVSSVNDANGANLGLEMRGSKVQLSAIGANPIQLYTNGSTRITIDSAGNVGIGSTNPGTALDVNGTIRATTFSGNVGVGTYQSSTPLIPLFNDTRQVGGGPSTATHRSSPMVRGGSVSVYFQVTISNSGTVYIRKNGVQVSSSLTATGSNTATYAVSAGDYFDVFISACSNTCTVNAFSMSALNPPTEQSVAADNSARVQPTIAFGTGAPNSSFLSCNVGDLYLRTDGGASTTLYVCTSASSWTAK